MILITGTNLTVNDLPNNDIMDYQIETTRMAIKLKTIAKSSECFCIYIAEDKRTDYTITDEIASKIIYFKDDADLLNKLNNGAKSDYVDPFEEKPVEEKPVEAPSFEPPEPVVEETPVIKVNLTKTDETSESKNDEHNESDSNNTHETVEEVPSLIPNVDIEEVSGELSETLFEIPNIGEDTDSLKEQLKTKDRIIAQKDGMISELKKKINDVYSLQEKELIEVEDTWKKKLEEAQGIITSLNNKASSAYILDDETTNFLKFIRYAQNSKAIVKESFTDDELRELGSLASKYTAFACGPGDSNYNMLNQVSSFISRNPRYLIVDFTNDGFLSLMYKFKSSNENILGLLRDDVNPMSIMKNIQDVRYIPATSYNDITLLNIDWVKLIKKLDSVAYGTPVLFLFGNINNFAVRYTISKLANIMKLHIFVKCAPMILSSLYVDIQYIPRDRISSIVAVQYYEGVQNVLAEMAKRYPIIATVNEVDWNKLEMF